MRCVNSSLRIRINDAREQINGGFCKKLLALIDGGKLNLLAVRNK